MQDLAERIKATGLKKAYIAEQVGITAGTLSRIIKGVQPYTSKELEDRLNSFLDANIKKK